MSRAYYSNSIPRFLTEDPHKIMGTLTLNHYFALEDLQKNAWVNEIEILKNCLSGFLDGHIFLEYSIPRMGKRVDAVILKRGTVFVIEFKVGEDHFSEAALDQVLDYAIDLKNFHEQSWNRVLVPILIATHAQAPGIVLESYQDRVYVPIKANPQTLRSIILDIDLEIDESPINPIAWDNSNYRPTPTIIEAAQALYAGHKVEEISRSDAGKINLSRTTDAIFQIIRSSEERNEKSICFVTGVPGAGKTLAGLNIATKSQNADLNEHAVFLSGNGPLVNVLREALARDEVENSKHTGSKIAKADADRRVKEFIQNIHHFRDDALKIDAPPVENVVIFDEAQRAWTLDQTSSFMKKKRGILDFAQSEPEFLISVMDRHPDWATIICLVGGGQEINTGEAGLPEWFKALGRRYPHWKIYTSSKLLDYEYTRGENIFELLQPNQLISQEDLHLSVSIRSFRSEKVSDLVKAILDCEPDRAKLLYQEICPKYPIVISRDLQSAKEWLKHRARGNERYGILASSGAYRLRPFGIHIKADIDVVDWFLNPKSDIRSSYYLEEAATEFDVQGLELDWACVAWDADFRYSDFEWDYRRFLGTNWQKINDETRKLYLKNTYRVLLTRARQGMVIFVPPGSPEDRTRQASYYDGVYEYLQGIGFETIQRH